ncbi:UNVERIFIED_CONTAM: hypothetical protein HDU68_012738, partial [Siphonaria sp. JEL0065]
MGDQPNINNPSLKQVNKFHQKALSTLPPNCRIPRKKWKSHANYQTNSMLLKSHDRFRKVSGEIVEGIKTLDHSTLLTAKGKSPKVLKDMFLDWH